MEQRRIFQNFKHTTGDLDELKLQIGGLKQVEAKLQRLREEQHEQSIYVQQIGDIWKMIKKRHYHLPFWDRYMKMSEFRRAKRIMDMYPSLSRSKL
jgi:hypothetical protein